jgi:hypothetical protein
MAQRHRAGSTASLTQVVGGPGDMVAVCEFAAWAERRVAGAPSAVARLATLIGARVGGPFALRSAARGPRLTDGPERDMFGAHAWGELG